MRSGHVHRPRPKAPLVVDRNEAFRVGIYVRHVESVVVRVRPVTGSSKETAALNA
jgi:hypothetical protein